MSQNSAKKDVLCNHQIRSFKIRVIKDGVQLGVLDKSKAIELAKDMGLDLIEVSKQDNMSICIIADYGKYKYDQSIKDKQKRKSQVVSEEKELLFSPTIERHDLEIQVSKLREFIEAGSTVKLTVRIKKKKFFVPSRDMWVETLNTVLKSIEDIASLISPPVHGGRTLTAKVGPKKQEGK